MGVGLESKFRSVAASNRHNSGRSCPRYCSSWRSSGVRRSPDIGKPAQTGRDSRRNESGPAAASDAARVHRSRGNWGGARGRSESGPARGSQGDYPERTGHLHAQAHFFFPRTRFFFRPAHVSESAPPSAARSGRVRRAMKKPVVRSRSGINCRQRGSCGSARSGARLPRSSTSSP